MPTALMTVAVDLPVVHQQEGWVSCHLYHDVHHSSYTTHVGESCSVDISWAGTCAELALPLAAAAVAVDALSRAAPAAAGDSSFSNAAYIVASAMSAKSVINPRQKPTRLAQYQGA